MNFSFFSLFAAGEELRYPIPNFSRAYEVTFDTTHFARIYSDLYHSFKETLKTLE
jgi:hypothetical protein